MSWRVVHDMAVSGSDLAALETWGSVAGRSEVRVRIRIGKHCHGPWEVACLCYEVSDTEEGVGGLRNMHMWPSIEGQGGRSRVTTFSVRGEQIPRLSLQRFLDGLGDCQGKEAGAGAKNEDSNIAGPDAGPSAQL